MADKRITPYHIERFLCVEGISYVKVDNEIHSPNLILRFYEFKEYLDSMINVRLKEEMKEKSLDDLLGLFENGDLELMSGKTMKTPEDFGLMEAGKCVEESVKKMPCKNKNKRKQLQQENRRYLQKLK